MHNLDWLQYWFFANCSGCWEHREGLKIVTLDNPGWVVEISLTDTEVEDKYFAPVDICRSEDEWIYAKVELSKDGKNDTFRLFCGPQNLSEAVGIFRSWVGEDITMSPKDYHYWSLKGGDPAKREKTEN